MAELLLEDLNTEQFLTRRRPGGGTLFGDRIININQIAKTQGLCQSHLSRAFRGERELLMKEVRCLAAILGMSIGEFMEAFEARLVKMKANQKQMLEEYEARVSQEDHENLDRVRNSRPTVPSIPGTRA